MSSTMGSDPNALGFQTSGSALPTGYTEPSFSPTEAIGDEENTFWQQYQSNPALQQFVQQNYGYLSWMLQIPELAKILVSAALGQWDQGKVSGAVSGTQWYKTASQTMRDWQTLQSTDPATAAQRLDATKWQIWQDSQQSGIALQPDQVTSLATSANMFGWDTTTLNQIIRNQYATAANTSDQMGESASFTNQAKQLAGQFLVPMSDQTIQDWAIRAVKGQTNVDGLTDYLRQQAGTLYTWAQPALQQGMTMTDYLNPYREAAAKTLAVSPDQIDWLNPKYMGALTAQAQDGTAGIKNMDQFVRTLKTDPQYGYQNTQDAMNQAYGLAKTLETSFGKVA